MKKLIPLLVLVLAAGFVASKLRAPKNSGAFDVVGFSELPILLNGRLKPLDTVARSSLLQLQRRQRVSSPTAGELVGSPAEWLIEVAFRPEKADTFPTFVIDNPDVLALVGQTEESVKITYETTGRKILSTLGFIPSNRNRFSLDELKPHIDTVLAQARLANQVETALRTPFQRSVLQLYHNLEHYRRLRHAFVEPGRPDFLGELMKFQEQVAGGVAAVRAKTAGQPHDEAAAAAMMAIAERFVDMANTSSQFLVIPPEDGSTDPTDWKPTGAALLETFRSGRVSSSALAYAGFSHAWRNNQPEQFNKLVELYRAELEKRFTSQLKKADVEARFNAAQPFYQSTIVYCLAFFLGVFSWLRFSDALRKSGYWLLALAWVLTTAGIATRMWLEGRPPVTNLYSSALFVGWGTVGLCLILEAWFKNAIGTVAGGAVGFATLIIAHNLSLSGDTLEMMQAVLDSNFWLATHVVVVTAGYSATFLAGFLALIYVIRGVFTRSLDKATADALARMVYGIVCFATLFSFVGTILGGIWADQSWGRFWGWDPKENGALIIVIWNAIILHARWGGMIKQRGLMCLAIGGNIATAWSWFGTNMLGVGLHSYGFTDSGFIALVSFVLSQLIAIGIANLPLEMWRSFKSRAKLPLAPEHVEEPVSASTR